MRVYIQNLPLEIPKSLLNMKKTREYSEKRLISNEGIFIIDNNSIKKLYFHDDKVIKINVNNQNFICDNSTITKKKWNKIPYDHIVQDVKITEYLDYYKFKIVVEKNNNKIKELYFETADVENLKENINTLYFR